MGRKVATLLAGLLALGVVAGPAVADDDEGHETPLHAHMLVQRPQVEYLEEGPEGEGLYLVGWRRCVDLPVVPLRAHHARLHTGNAGEKLFERAGHVVIPSGGLAPWEDCAGFSEFLPLLVD
jgi:hypothetical protein